MNSLLDRESSLTIEAVQEDEIVPECLQSYQPLVMLWSEKRPRQAGQEVDLQFSENYQGITDVKYEMHDVTSRTIEHNDDGTTYVLLDCNF